MQTEQACNGLYSVANDVLSICLPNFTCLNPAAN